MKLIRLAFDAKCLVFLCAFAATNTGWADSTVASRVGDLEFASGYPTEATAQKLYDELDFQRAVQAYLWAMPFVSYAAATDATLAKGANNHTVVIQPNSAEQQQLILTGRLSIDMLQDTALVRIEIDVVG